MMCEWGVREPWKWGSTTGATTWRATYDTRDCWQGKSGGIGVAPALRKHALWPLLNPTRSTIFRDDVPTAQLHTVSISATVSA